MKTALRSVLFLASLLFLTGCVYTSLEAPGGVKLKRLAVGTGTQIGELSIPTAQGSATLKGYTSEQAQVAAAVVEAAISAAKK